jgi:two-component system response regulator DctR
MSGLVLQERLNELRASIPVILLTGHGDVPMAVQAMRSGAVDFIQKPYREQALLDSINAALTTDAAARRSCVATDDIEQRLSSLTGREREVLDKILSGLTSKETARELGVSPRTVEAHRKNLLQKLGIATVKALILRFTSLEPGSRGM